MDLDDQRGVVLEELRPDTELADQYIVSRASTRATQFSAYSFISHVRLVFKTRDMTNLTSGQH